MDRDLIGYVHLGTPCTIWSRARHNVRDSHATRCKEETGIELALFSCEVIKKCIAKGIPYALENPRTSKLFNFSYLVQAVSCGPFHFVDWEMCQYGEKYKKSTRMVTSVDWLHPISRRCHHRSHEVRLQGKVKSCNSAGRPVYVNRTTLAGAYPIKFCQKYASLIHSHVSFGHAREEVAMQWSASLRRVASIPSSQCRPKDKCRQTQEFSCGDLELFLYNAGGLERFYDCISLGRTPKQAWKKLE